MRAWSLSWMAARFVAGAVLVAAIVTQLVHTIGISADRGLPIAATVVEFFSYFTNLAASGGAITLVIGGVLLARRRATVDPRWFAVLLVAVTTYMIITGIVYNLLLRNAPATGLTVPWTNEVRHVWAPLFFLVDLFVGPRRRAVSWATLGTVLIFPLAWAAYTLVRGPLVTDFRTGQAWWYPYPFLDPHRQPWGYGGVALYVVAITAAVLGIAALCIVIGGRRARRAAALGGDRPGSQQTVIPLS
jgi:hypothetical protein